MKNKFHFFKGTGKKGLTSITNAKLKWHKIKQPKKNEMIISMTLKKLKKRKKI